MRIVESGKCRNLEIRAKESADFAANEKELLEVTDTLVRAIGLLKRSMHSSKAMRLFQRRFSSVAQALGAKG